ncbi:D-glycero-beta-D-manno-heptose-7-phosphate kinase [Candidatus Paracaedibacter symbiosus]|uniref:D-glycero-beta-D-manno-heptose-7-phosphate kinase n=1 Tax=Candidatus Paracaedibacter symbiosus TaxID=244582 RepID=UPI0005094F58|nr:D-glycero-beta-D-manno-heptose-7-phosphate kinase [Candidatus Paracaedibacter symbiosus]
MQILQKAAAFFEKSECRILCIGDIMLDKYVYGNVSRISPEAPVPVLHLQSEFEMLGGLGNVVNNLTSFLVHPVIISAIGEDKGGHRIQEIIGAQGETFFVKSPKTSIKTRYVSNGQQLLRMDDEMVCQITAAQVAEIAAFVETQIRSVKAIILSDYGKGVLTPELCQAVIKTARLHNVPVIVDPKGGDYIKYTGATLITPNLKEFREVCGKKITAPEELVSAARGLIDQFQLQGLLVTQGAGGMTLVTKDEQMHATATAREVFDVSGAGDTVIATLTIALSKGVDVNTSCVLANAAAGVVVSKAGTATVTPEELQHALSLKPINTYEEKILPLSRLETVVQSWRHQNLKVGFTNGCYDLLHAGHLRSLQEAKQQCDRLIVAVNTDESIKQLKGPERPIQAEEVRSLVLAALELVDAVILFGTETPLHLLETIIPDVLIKGADYTVDQVVGADLVLRNGGRVHLVQLKEGQSTTNLVQKMKEQAVG